MSRRQSETNAVIRRERFVRATGSTNRDVQNWLLDQLINALPFAADAPPERQKHIAEAALTMMESIAPQDAIEAMLAVQMIAAHAAAMECTRRAKAEEQSIEARDHYLRHAAGLTALFGRQATALRGWRAAQRRIDEEANNPLHPSLAVSDHGTNPCGDR